MDRKQRHDNVHVLVTSDVFNVYSENICNLSIKIIE